MARRVVSRHSGLRVALKREACVLCSPRMLSPAGRQKAEVQGMLRCGAWPLCSVLNPVWGTLFVKRAYGTFLA